MSREKREIYFSIVKKERITLRVHYAMVTVASSSAASGVYFPYYSGDGVESFIHDYTHYTRVPHFRNTRGQWVHTHTLDMGHTFRF